MRITSSFIASLLHAGALSALLLLALGLNGCSRDRQDTEVRHSTDDRDLGAGADDEKLGESEPVLADADRQDQQAGGTGDAASKPVESVPEEATPADAGETDTVENEPEVKAEADDDIEHAQSIPSTEGPP